MNDVAEQLRAAMRTYPTGVTIVTTMLEGIPHGFTANAFTSVSLDPPSVLICVNRRAKSHQLIAAAGRFCVNIMRDEQRALAGHFSRSIDGDQFLDVPWSPTERGLPRLHESLSWLDCELAEEHTVATHTIFVGTVQACGIHHGRPLGYFNGEFHDFGVAVAPANT